MATCLGESVLKADTLTWATAVRSALLQQAGADGKLPEATVESLTTAPVGIVRLLPVAEGVTQLERSGWRGGQAAVLDRLQEELRSVKSDPNPVAFCHVWVVCGGRP